MDDMKINIGDLVYVVDKGSSYPNYENMAKKLNVTNWSKGKLPNTKELYIVKDGHIHFSFKNRYVFWIRSLSTGKDYLVGSNGLKVDTFNSTVFFSEDEFKI